MQLSVLNWPNSQLVPFWPSGLLCSISYTGVLIIPYCSSLTKRKETSEHWNYLRLRNMALLWYKLGWVSVNVFLQPWETKRNPRVCINKCIGLSHTACRTSQLLLVSWISTPLSGYCPSSASMVCGSMADRANTVQQKITVVVQVIWHRWHLDHFYSAAHLQVIFTISCVVLSGTQNFHLSSASGTVCAVGLIYLPLAQLPTSLSVTESV